MADSFKRFFRLLYRYWMKFAHVLGWINTRILLTLFYFVILTPFALLVSLFKRDLLDQSFKPNEPTYWLPKEKAVERERYLKPY